MHYYQKHIGDFNNATRHLTRVERSLYSDAIELYYETEKPLVLDFERLCKLLLAVTDEEKTALKSILSEFFTQAENGYFNKRCNEAIVKYQSFIDSRSRAGKASAEKRNNTCSTRVQHKGNTRATNHKPITNNQDKDISANADSALPKKINGNRFIKPSLFEVAEYCKERGNKINPENFIDHYTANGWKVGGNPMKDWKASVRTWEKNNYGKNTGKFVMTSEVINADF